MYKFTQKDLLNHKINKYTHKLQNNQNFESLQTNKLLLKLNNYKKKYNEFINFQKGGGDDDITLFPNKAWMSDHSMVKTTIQKSGDSTTDDEFNVITFNMAGIADNFLEFSCDENDGLRFLFEVAALVELFGNSSESFLKKILTSDIKLDEIKIQDVGKILNDTPEIVGTMKVIDNKYYKNDKPFKTTMDGTKKICEFIHPGELQIDDKNTLETMFNIDNYVQNYNKYKHNDEFTDKIKDNFVLYSKYWIIANYLYNLKIKEAEAPEAPETAAVAAPTAPAAETAAATAAAETAAETAAATAAATAEAAEKVAAQTAAAATAAATAAAAAETAAAKTVAEIEATEKVAAAVAAAAGAATTEVEKVVKETAANYILKDFFTKEEEKFTKIITKMSELTGKEQTEIKSTLASQFKKQTETISKDRISKLINHVTSNIDEKTDFVCIQECIPVNNIEEFASKLEEKNMGIIFCENYKSNISAVEKTNYCFKYPGLNTNHTYTPTAIIYDYNKYNYIEDVANLITQHTDKGGEIMICNFKKIVDGEITDDIVKVCNAHLKSSGDYENLYNEAFEKYNECDIIGMDCNNKKAFEKPSEGKSQLFGNGDTDNESLNKLLKEEADSDPIFIPSTEAYGATCSKHRGIYQTQVYDKDKISNKIINIDTACKDLVLVSKDKFKDYTLSSKIIKTDKPE